MGILSFLRNLQNNVSNNTGGNTNTGPASADGAKGRLQVLIAHDRTHRNGPAYLPQLKQDIIDVIKKYANVGEEQVMVNLDTQDNRDILELNITLPEDADVKTAAATAPAAVEKSAFASEAEKAAKKSTKSAAKETKPAKKGNKKAKSNKSSRKK